MRRLPLSGELQTEKCKPCEGEINLLSATETDPLISSLSGWIREGNTIVKNYRFKDYYDVLAFVNATAWISHREDHYPDLTTCYQQSRVRFATHAIGGLSTNDFICAAKMDALFGL